ncbi:MAG: hypothetical protein ACTSUE_01825 [Promethearchaeota archaeon]
MTAMIDGIYIIRENGVCFASIDNGMVTDTDKDLITPFLTALNGFTQSNFKGKLKALELEDEDGNEKEVYFRDLKIQGASFRMVAVFSKHKTNHKEIDAKMVKLKWTLQEKGYYKYLASPNRLPPDFEHELHQKINNIFRII